MNIGKATRNDANILRRRLLKIEAAIKMTVIMAGHKRSPLAEANANIAKIIAGIDDDFISLPPLTESRQERLGRLFSERARLLNEMFLATPAEIERFEKMNALLYDLTQKLYTHAGALYRKTIVGYDREFTDDMEFEGELHYSYNGRESRLWLEEDEYYGSDFDCMLNILDQYVAHYRKHDMVNWRKRFDPEDRPGMTEKELRIDDFLDDGEPWTEYPLHHPALQNILVCYATHVFCSHHDFSIPDLLRLNDFWVEIRATYQRFADQRGRSGLAWWDKCSFEEFRRKILDEADHRPKGWSRGQFISKRCRQAILEDEDFGSENDPLHDDGKIDEFISDVFAELHRPHGNPAKSSR